MTNVSVVEKMAELMQQMEENSPRVAALQYCLSEVAKRITELEQKLAESQREFRAADATNENLQMQVEKLAAENAGLKECNTDIMKHVYRSKTYLESSRVVDAIQGLQCAIERKSGKTPATDAVLAEVRAQGVEMLRDSIAEIEGGIEDTIDLHHYCSDFAECIRKGVQS
ncbi:hypothetical protein VB265_01210 [Enterobacter sichuanensis]|uniref:hypothetical protein n=1 Tax=Enterobacter sichuanensis TaxID=2071710 RepID=UPI002B1ED5AE|nr:hypothetical protein [Enterobacter sichuanensis]MEA5168166.1 hypothetical protein [Enterobacter sichuanensis]